MNTESVIDITSWNIRELERLHIIQCLMEHDYNRTHTAKALGIGLRTLQRKLYQYNLNAVFSGIQLKEKLDEYK